MSLIARVKQDVERITADQTEWAVPLYFEAPSGETADISGVFSERTMQVPEGQDERIINTIHADISFSEKSLTDLNYPVRDENNDVNLKDHVVVATIPAGIVQRYKIQEWRPDHTIGLIVCTLEALSENE